MINIINKRRLVALSYSKPPPSPITVQDRTTDCMPSGGNYTIYITDDDNDFRLNELSELFTTTAPVDSDVEVWLDVGAQQRVPNGWLRFIDDPVVDGNIKSYSVFNGIVVGWVWCILEGGELTPP